MSRIGRKPITVPDNVKVSVKDRVVSVTGPQGTLSLTHRPEFKVTWEQSEKAIKVECVATDPEAIALVSPLWGTCRALIRNMVEGVSKGYEESLEVVGVGYTASLAGKQLKLVVGFANAIFLAIPEGVKVVVDKQIIRVSGPDRQAVGMFASTVRSQRKPEPYNGKGVKYLSETIKRKAGKAFGA